jgi:hypothetical protein
MTYGRVVGVDVAEQALRSAPRGSNVEYKVLDLEDRSLGLDFGGLVRLFLAVGLFELLAAPGELCRRLYEQAAPDGRILVVIPNRRSLHYATLRAELWIARMMLRRSSVFVSHNGANGEDVVDWLHESGFRPIASGAIVGAPPALLSLMPASLQAVLIRLDQLALRLIGGSYHWVLAQRPET